jgi:hypothetical protein
MKLIIRRFVATDLHIQQAGVGARRRLVDLRRTFHVQGFVIEDVDELVEAGLLLQDWRKFRSRR